MKLSGAMEHHVSMKSIQILNPGAGLSVSERSLPEPGPGSVRVKVAACGVCHSDALVMQGYWPGVAYPRVPGHEIAGVIDTLGSGVTAWKVGDRVGVGWHGSHCNVCIPCRSGDFILCVNLKITGFDFDGGYQQYMIAPENGLARIPAEIDAADAAPLLCAGVTTYNSLRHTAARPGDLVAIHGIGGLGHLGVQFARKMGFHVVAISRGKDKEELALRLGAHRYLDGASVNAAEELARMGGARVIVATAPNSEAISGLVGGLGPNGVLLAIAGTADPMSISPAQLIGKRLSIQGFPSGSPMDSEETLNFCALTGIRPMIEKLPLDQAARGFERMITNQVRFRAVLVNE
jgi:D-arabinose 1-dehydrogenase-like Zn-dependent alcohol dehydrogenase